MLEAYRQVPVCLARRPLKQVRRPRLALSRHNGIGDIVMLVPLLGFYLQRGYDVMFFTETVNHEWLQWLFPKLKARWPCSRASDYSVHLDGFDHYLNFDQLERADEQALDLKYPCANWQYLQTSLARMQGLPVPTELAPSAYVTQVCPQHGKTLVFTQSSSPSRTLGETVVRALKDKYPKAVFNPDYPSRLELVQAVGGAARVIGADTGPIHLAEMFGVPWTCLSTTMCNTNRHLFYKHGRVVQAGIACSPCYRHPGCGDLQCVDKFDVTDI